jgi:hypothetical protein
MRHRLSLLLLALLPALIVPAGTLRFCLCDTSPGAPECCCKTQCDEGDGSGPRLNTISSCSGCQVLTTPKRTADVIKETRSQTLSQLALVTLGERSYTMPASLLVAPTPHPSLRLSPTISPPLRI